MKVSLLNHFPIVARLKNSDHIRSQYFRKAQTLGIGIQTGDRAKSEISPSDSTRGRIICRLHNKDSSDSFSIPFQG